MIKNFVYLDVEKLYSLSSQIFEGITEYVLNESYSEKNNSEEQKGPVGSGRVLGDILKLGATISEKKYLNDYSFNLFEKKLLDDNKVIIIDSSNEVKNISQYSFIKVKSQAIFNDINLINYTLENFNEIGKAFAHVTSHDEINNLTKQVEQLKLNTKDKNQRAQLDKQLKDASDITKIAKEKGMHNDQSYLDDLTKLLKFGFQDQLEVQMEINNSLYSANLKRENLKENENIIIRKYSRRTEVEFTLFGIITQAGKVSTDKTEEKKSGSMKSALMNLIFHLTNLESSFTGRMDNEIIIDPIALYTELI